MYKEYRAVINMLVPVRMMVILDQEKVETMIMNSPTKLMVGGRARFVKLDIVHQSAMRGRIVCMPRIRIIVRL